MPSGECRLQIGHGRFGGGSWAERKFSVSGRPSSAESVVTPRVAPTRRPKRRALRCGCGRDAVGYYRERGDAGGTEAQAQGVGVLDDRLRFGDGGAELLERIEALGSIKQAVAVRPVMATWPKARRAGRPSSTRSIGRDITRTSPSSWRCATGRGPTTGRSGTCPRCRPRGDSDGAR